MDFHSFYTSLYGWYDLNARNLPWRSTKDGYSIWVSEVILQQTQVKQGLSYYMGFLNAFPTVIDLANASEDEVLTLWQGLGYYSRARNMHKAAQIVRDEFNGCFPTTYTDLLKLPGIGSYTAAAVASFSNNEAVGVLDGNVFRFFSRLFNNSTPVNTSQGKNEFSLIVDNVLDRNNPSKFNQAIMEFGALVCTPKSPCCTTCCFKSTCKAFKMGNVFSLPAKLAAQSRRERFLNYLLIESFDGIVIVRRGDDDIWANLYQLPIIESVNNDISDSTWFDLLTLSFSDKLFSELIFHRHHTVKHLLSHQILHIGFTILEVNALLMNSILEGSSSFVFLRKSDLDLKSFPAPIYKFLHR